MLERIKKALVESFVGVIVVGSLFASGILSLASGISTPLANWLSEWIQQAKSPAGYPNQPPQFFFLPFIREWISAALLLLIACLLLRWLYIEPSAAEPSDPSQVEDPEESA
jgi:hypothetical protein